MRLHEADPTKLDLMISVYTDLNLVPPEGCKAGVNVCDIIRDLGPVSNYALSVSDLSSSLACLVTLGEHVNEVRMISSSSPTCSILMDIADSH